MSMNTKLFITLTLAATALIGALWGAIIMGIPGIVVSVGLSMLGFSSVGVKTMFFMAGAVIGTLFSITWAVWKSPI